MRHAPPDGFPPVTYLGLAAHRYTRSSSPEPDYTQVTLERRLGERIADAYAAAPILDSHALSAYHRFQHETRLQFEFLIAFTGLTIRLVDEEPYPDARTMADDLRQGFLRVLSTRACANPHPLLSDADNDKFRAIHDAFGHATIGRGFTPDGEEAAWLKHRTMYSSLARQALATEARGQSCAQTFHYGGQFPVQKAAILPAAFH